MAGLGERNDIGRLQVRQNVKPKLIAQIRDRHLVRLIRHITAMIQVVTSTNATQASQQ
jgi:hypothetical protein